MSDIIPLNGFADKHTEIFLARKKNRNRERTSKT